MCEKMEKVCTLVVPTNVNLGYIKPSTLSAPTATGLCAKWCYSSISGYLSHNKITTKSHHIVAYLQRETMAGIKLNTRLTFVLMCKNLILVSKYMWKWRCPMLNTGDVCFVHLLSATCHVVNSKSRTSSALPSQWWMYSLHIIGHGMTPHNVTC